jgi:drug/metabolite transporter (DMT)-like permease
MPRGAERAAPGRALGIVFAALGALGFACKAILVKIAYGLGADPITLLALRMLYALPCFIVMGLVAQHSAAVPLRRADYAALLGLGLVGYYASSFLDFLGLQYVSASLERVILFVYPTLVVLIGACLKQRAPSRSVLAGVIICYAGVVTTFLNHLQRGQSQVLIGGALVFASAVCFAVYLLGSAPLLQRLGSTRVTAWATGFASLAVLAQFALLRPAASLVLQPARVQELAILMALFCTVLPIWLVAEAIRRLGAAPAAVIGSMGPVYTMVLAYLLLGEPLGPWQLLGAALVIFGVRLISRPTETGPTAAG